MKKSTRGVSALDIIFAEQFLLKYFDCQPANLESTLLNFEKRELCHLLAVFSQELSSQPADDRGNLTLIILNNKK